MVLKIIGFWLIGYLFALIFFPSKPNSVFGRIYRYLGKYFYRIIIATAFAISSIWLSEILRIIGFWLMGYLLALILFPSVPTGAFGYIYHYPGKHDHIYRNIIATAFVIFIIWVSDGGVLKPSTIF